MRNILWTLSTLIGICSMFSVTLFYIPSYNYSQIESALYNSLHRLGWSIFTGWLVLGCATSEGNALKTFLSSQILVPLSRLTYCAYLTNGFIELYMAASIRTPKHMSTSNLVSNYFHLKSKSYFILNSQTGETLSHVALTFLAALILCLMFESPIHGMERILLRRNAATHTTTQRDTKTSESDDLNAVSTSSHSPSTSEASA